MQWEAKAVEQAYAGDQLNLVLPVPSSHRRCKTTSSWICWCGTILTSPQSLNLLRTRTEQPGAAELETRHMRVRITRRRSPNC